MRLKGITDQGFQRIADSFREFEKRYPDIDLDWERDNWDEDDIEGLETWKSPPPEDVHTVIIDNGFNAIFEMIDGSRVESPVVGDPEFMFQEVDKVVNGGNAYNMSVQSHDGELAIHPTSVDGERTHGIFHKGEMFDSGPIRDLWVEHHATFLEYER